MTLDPTSDIGKVRLRVADYSDLPVFPDSVYLSVISDNDGNLVAASAVMARFILGALSHKTHRRLNQLEVWGAEAFKNYKDFLLLTISNPAFMDYSPIAQSSNSSEPNPLLSFVSDWNRNYYAGTDSQQLAFTADISPNDGSRLGPHGMSYVS